jgi:hypothetical protein
MIYLAVQGLFAIAFYPLFLIILSKITRHIQRTSIRSGKIINALACFLSLAITIISIYGIENPAAGLSLYLIASTIALVLISHYLCNQLGDTSHHRAYCFMLILQPVLSSALLLTQSCLNYPKGFVVDFLPLLLGIDCLRWILTTILAISTIKKYRLKPFFVLIGIGGFSFTIFLGLAIQLKLISLFH